MTLGEELYRVLGEASRQVKEWPDWKRSEETKRELEKLARATVVANQENHARIETAHRPPEHRGSGSPVILRVPRGGVRFLIRVLGVTIALVTLYAAAWMLPDAALPDPAPVRSGWVWEPGTVAHIHVVEATAYCTCPLCCGQWADGFTASGTRATAGRTLAADPARFPMGTCLAFPDGPRIVEDTGSAIVGHRVDVFFDTHHEALEFGRQILALFSC